MIKTASHFWGYNELQPEDSFDPLVGLLIGACASELEKLNREIHDTESRLIEKLIEILTPGPITSPLTAHGILHAHPSKPELTVDSSCQFYYPKKIVDQQTGKSEEKNLYFTPAGNYLLLDARIKYIAVHSNIYQLADDYKEIFIESDLNSKLPSNRIWVGIEWAQDLKNLNQLPLFINARNSYLRERLISFLPRTTWFFNGQKLESYTGFPHLSASEDSPLKQLEKEFSIIDKIITFTNRYYSDQFVTLDFKSIPPVTAENLAVPGEFRKTFSDKLLGKIEPEILWIEIHFPVVLEEEAAEDLYIFLNAFPVINRKLNEFTGSTRESLNIIPLDTDDLFLDLISVVGKGGDAYTSELFMGMNQLRSGSLLLRQGNIGRFDSSKAKEYLEYLIEVLKDESAAFNVIGSDLLHANLKELSQSIARLEKKINETDVSKSENHYLIVHPNKGDDLVFIQFWTTNGSISNNIKSGVFFNLYSGKDIIANSLRLLTSTIGGKERPGREERVNIYRSALLSKNRIVTEEDIKTLCYEHVGNNISKVKIHKGITEGSSSVQGFIRTIDVTIKFEDINKFSTEELYELKKGLLTKLEQRSAIVFPYRVFFT